MNLITNGNHKLPTFVEFEWERYKFSFKQCDLRITSMKCYPKIKQSSNKHSKMENEISDRSVYITIVTVLKNHFYTLYHNTKKKDKKVRFDY